MSFHDFWVDLCMATQYATGDPSGIAGFMVARGRLPRLDEVDGRLPWNFRGWMLPMVIGMDLAPGLPICGADDVALAPSLGRWGYWLHIREHGQIPGPPPQIDFDEPCTSTRAYRNLTDCCDQIGSEVGYSSSPGQIIEWLAWALAVTHETPRLSDELQERLYRTFRAFLWMARPSDYLGLLLSEFKGRAKDPTAFFPTPSHLVEIMTRLAVDHKDFDPARTTYDPCVGTGRFLLEASNSSLQLAGQDINHTCVLATLVNGAFFAPWLSFPLIPRGAEFEPVAAVEMATEDDGQGLLFG